MNALAETNHAVIRTLPVALDANHALAGRGGGG